MKVFSDIVETVGHTPLVEVSGKINPTAARLLVKLERANPGGSAKDRVAVKMVEEAERRGELKKGGTIIEPTSGNTGVGLAMVSAVRGYHLILTMPDTMSVERQRLAAAYGAEIVLTPGADGMRGSIDKADELRRTIPGAVILGQFDNLDNARAHYLSTGPEIWEDTDGEIAAFVATVGTGGTISGTARYLKEKKPSVRVVAVEPDSSAVLSGGKPGPHKIQGIGAGFVPKVYDASVVDEVMAVSAEESGDAARRLASRDGILAGISSGAALSAALKVAARAEFAGKIVVALLPDTGERYLSTWLFE